VRRWLFNLAAVSFLIFVATSALALRSYWRRDSFIVARSTQTWELQSAGGRISVSTLRNHGLRPQISLKTVSLPEPPAVLSDIPRTSDDDWLSGPIENSHPFDKDWLTFWTEPGMPGPITIAVVVFPHWLLILPSAAFPAFCTAGLVRRTVRRSRGCCESCGYDLRASKDRCPECGTAIAPAAATTCSTEGVEAT
jgi:hypothetical protein